MSQQKYKLMFVVSAKSAYYEHNDCVSCVSPDTVGWAVSPYLFKPHFYLCRNCPLDTILLHIFAYVLQQYYTSQVETADEQN